MRAKQLFGITVLDKDVNEVGKIEDLEIDTETGNVTKIIISLNKGILSNDSIEVDFDKIATIGDYILLNNVISKDDDGEVEKVAVEVEDE
ncbi:MAG: PRC-barrel domain-containing protein [Methanobrevibacter sp.]|uniref:PRC-barrel domain-containing protein n=1 Tax=Methanobrevibacter sp. TaxID=66852 RepID=UPI0025CE3A25|nr:PRC-barrel domain-containing protein [Methanobrevibacter sp.]MBQ2613016.1 PRC-barrel domain-containing protein [Methanobrevibacter sp.]MEE0024500.1 PRC-barrel domain-containing protein [Methanobrevibacter sp.]